MHDTKEAEADQALGEEFDEMARQKLAKLNTKEGESLSLEDLQDIYMDVKGRAREA